MQREAIGIALLIGLALGVATSALLMKRPAPEPCVILEHWFPVEG